MSKEVDDCDYYITSEDSAYHCKICGKKTTSFTWSTSRYFDHDFCERVLNIPKTVELSIDGKKYIFWNRFVICPKCVKQYNLMEVINERRKIQ